MEIIACTLDLCRKQKKNSQLHLDVDFMSNLKIYVSSKDTNFTEHLCVSLKKPSDVSGKCI